MSYDLGVFEPSAAPTDPEEFATWFEAQTEWDEPHGYDNPVVASPALRAWFMDMHREFPPLNGPFARSGNEDDPRTADYSVGRTLIYVGFSWSQARAAYAACYRLAAKHRVGFLDVSGDDGGVWFPGEEEVGGLIRAFSLIPDE